MAIHGAIDGHRQCTGLRSLEFLFNQGRTDSSNARLDHRKLQPAIEAMQTGSLSAKSRFPTSALDRRVVAIVPVSGRKTGREQRFCFVSFFFWRWRDLRVRVVDRWPFGWAHRGLSVQREARDRAPYLTQMPLPCFRLFLKMTATVPNRELLITAEYKFHFLDDHGQVKFTNVNVGDFHAKPPKGGHSWGLRNIPRPKVVNSLRNDGSLLVHCQIEVLPDPCK